jgi:Zn ribbon nucleic-acid-binding protein
MKLLEVLSKPGEITVFHGSDHEISKFVDDLVGGSGANDQEGPGIYFTTSDINASHYGVNVYKAIIKPRKLLTTNARGGNIPELMKLAKMAPNWQETAMNWHENAAKGIIECVNSAYKYNDNEKDRFLQIWIEFYRNNPIDYVRNCVKLGYDGIMVDKQSIFEDQPIIHYIIYNPSIIFTEQ